jgi:hypothetical protein
MNALRKSLGAVAFGDSTEGNKATGTWVFRYMSAVHFRTSLSFFDALLAGRGGNCDAPNSNCKGPSCEGRHGAELSLVEEQELPLGSHLVTPRRGYVHHGIHVGDGKVVHYAGLAHGLRRGPVEEISLARFTNGRPVCVRSDASLEFDRREVIRRARSRIGEDHYRLLTNNCEHFCEWCLYGEHRSYQVEEWLARPVRALHAAIRFIAHLLSPPGGIVPRAGQSPTPGSAMGI